jgi:putative FmdB family regulatory protein
MPTYEYACTSCQRRFDVVQSFSDDPLTTCEECGGALKRVFHPVGVVLKGSGFYATDNRSSKALAPKKSSEGGDSSSSSSESSSSSTKKDAAPKKKDT